MGGEGGGGKDSSHANWGGTILFFSFLVLTGCDLKPGGELFFASVVLSGSGLLALGWCVSGVVVMFAVAHLFCQGCGSG